MMMIMMMMMMMMMAMLSSEGERSIFPPLLNRETGEDDFVCFVLYG